MLTERDEYESFTDAAGRPKKRLIRGLSLTAARMIDSGNTTIASLAGRFVREHGQDELSGIQSTADTQTQWMLSEPMRTDLEKDGVDFHELRRQTVSVFVVLPAGEVTRKRRWTRVVLATALAAHLGPAPMKTLFVLDEFRASIGPMPIVNDMWSLVRGFGVQLMPILQSALQLQALFKEEWENYAAQAGIVATLGPPGDLFTAKWMSERSGVTTVVQAGFNLGDSTSAGEAINAGVSGSWLNSTPNKGDSSNAGLGTTGGISFQQVEQRAVLPQQLMDLPLGHGRLWVPGMGTRSIPFFAPNYWKYRAEWVARVKKNPFRSA